MARILKGQVLALFAFDIGYEVSLEHLARISSATPVQPLSRKRRTPTYMQYSRPPVVLSLPAGEEFLGQTGIAQATVFDFGAVTIAYRWPLAADNQPLRLEQLAQVSSELYSRNLEVQARDEVMRLVDRIRPAIVRPELSALVEDYYLFVIEQIEPLLSAAELLKQYRLVLAQVLSFETTVLSKEQQDELLGERMSYYENDLTILDWNAAIICDAEFEDAIAVLELLNVELLEARWIDALLDRRVDDYASLVQQRPQWPLPLRAPYKRAVEELTELRLEYTLLAERVGNSLKLVGDLYLSRLHTAGARRVHLPEWERIIRHKLKIMDELYDRLNDRVRTAQSQALELTIIALIVVEVFLALFK
jgi:hypothetical protein